MADIRTFAKHTPKIADTAYLDARCCVIGDVVIGDQTNIWPGVVIRGDVNPIRIGERTNIQDNSVLHNSHDSEFLPGGSPLLIGHAVTIGHQAMLHGCEIGDYCLVGMGAIVLDRAVLEPEVMLGAGSLVPSGKTLRSGYLYIGSPAQAKRPLSDDEKRYLHYSAEHYLRLAAEHQAR